MSQRGRTYSPIGQAITATAAAVGQLGEASALVGAVGKRHLEAGTPFGDLLANGQRELDFAITNATSALREIIGLSEVG